MDGGWRIENGKNISPTEFSRMDAAWQGIGGMLNRMIERAADFCRGKSSAAE
jgi:hypothetical protein